VSLLVIFASSLTYVVYAPTICLTFILILQA
jgi:hypothetical protein